MKREKIVNYCKEKDENEKKTIDIGFFIRSFIWLRVLYKDNYNTNEQNLINSQ